MMRHPALRKALTNLEAALQTSGQRLRHQTSRTISTETLQRAVPTVATVSFWQSLIPKPFRRDAKSGTNVKAKSKEWNPATFYIAIFILIGSMSMQQIALKRDSENFLRQADVKIGRLQEVVKRLQNGEKFDVEAALGTGNPAAEHEWERMLKDIERAGPIGNKPKQWRKPSAGAQPGPETQKTTVTSVSAGSFF